MSIVPAMLISIIIKAVSAIIEIVIQLIISNHIGVNFYGKYTLFTSVIECTYFIFLSGSVKVNTFYLSDPNTKLNTFKKKYLFKFIMPLLFLSWILAILTKNYYVAAFSILVFFYYKSMDYSSTFFARRKQLMALLGEYLIGRLVLLFSLIICLNLKTMTTNLIFLLLLLQYLAIVIWFIIFKGKIRPGVKDEDVPFRKILEFQESDIASSFITYSPTILQYVFLGTFATAFIGVISVVRKFVYFISGPTAKVFLPEFSRLFQQHKYDKLRNTYLMIVRLQMIFIGIIGVVVTGFPSLVLKLFNSKLANYSTLFMLTGVCLLFIASLGPVVGILQMTGNETAANRNQWISICLMLITWLIFHNNKYFIVIGLCVQALAEGLLEFTSISIWMKRIIIKPLEFLVLWLPVIISKCLILVLKLENSWVALIAFSLLVFIANLLLSLRDNMIKMTIINFWQEVKNANK